MEFLNTKFAFVLIPDLHSKITVAFHDSALGGHFGFPVTYKRISALFRWICIKTSLKMVRSCTICQHAKAK